MSTSKLLRDTASIALFGAIFLMGATASDGTAATGFDERALFITAPDVHPPAFQLLTKGTAGGKTGGASASQPAGGGGAQSTEKKKSEGVKSQAEKKLEQQRKDLIRNWGG